jgi:hypothetical protein
MEGKKVRVIPLNVDSVSLWSGSKVQTFSKRNPDGTMGLELPYEEALPLVRKNGGTLTILDPAFVVAKEGEGGKPPKGKPPKVEVTPPPATAEEDDPE